MTETIIPVQYSTLGAKAWKPFSDYHFAAASAVAPLSAEEVAHAAHIYPLAFATGEHSTLLAVLGLQPGRNLLVGENGRWITDYVPATFRAYPFKLIRIGEEQVALGYDKSSGLLVDEGRGEAFFGPDGEPTQRIRDLLQFLVTFNRGQQTAAAFGGKLKDAGILEPWPLAIEEEGGRKITVQGLLRVNEQALGALDDAAFLELRQSGALMLAYAQLFSMANITSIGRLAQIHTRQAQQVATLNRPQNSNAPIFAAPGGDTINWDMLLKDDRN
ncbi:MAG: SapC family protein [Agrobacterium sp.]|nr:SapC family protein [Agrobacterium sp.]